MCLLHPLWEQHGIQAEWSDWTHTVDIASQEPCFIIEYRAGLVIEDNLCVCLGRESFCLHS